MATYTNPNFVNGQTPPISADNLNDLANAVAGLTVPNGGTGKTSFTSGAFLTGNGTGAITETTTIPVSKGGTGVTTLSALKTNLGAVSLIKQSSAPSDTTAIWFNTSNYTLNVYYSGSWRAVRGVFS